VNIIIYNRLTKFIDLGARKLENTGTIKHVLCLDDRKLSIIVFSLFFSWLLAFPFQGQVLYLIANQYNIDPKNMVFGSIVAHFLGLFFSGFFVKTMRNAKYLMLFSVIFCIVGTSIFFLNPSMLWYIFIIISSLFSGICVAAWGYYFKKCTPTNERIKTAADVLIFSNILMIIMNMVAINVSAYAGLSLSILALFCGLFFIVKLPENDEVDINPPRKMESMRVTKPLAFLCLFIAIITINSGLMYQVINPAFAHHEFLVSWYWAVPYIVAIYIIKNLPKSANRTYLLYVAIAMIGFAFIAFMIFDRSVISYLIVDTLMLGACGVYDLFWWSILGEMVDFNKNPAKILGIGLSANVMGVLIGGLIGNAIATTEIQNMNSSVVALTVVFITLIFLPVLHKQLLMILENHVYLTVFNDMSKDKQTEVIGGIILIGQLTERESEIARLLLKGRTYKMIATELYLSENTVKTHIKNIYSKFNIQSKTELVKLLMEKYPSTFK